MISANMGEEAIKATLVTFFTIFVCLVIFHWKWCTGKKSNLQKFLDINKSFLGTKDEDGTEYFIKRESIVKKLKRHILSCESASTVVNVIGNKSIGKSTMVKVAAKQIARENKKYKIFYVDGSRTLKLYFSRFGIEFDDEMSAANAFIDFIELYTELKEAKDKRIIVIIDSPGGIEELFDTNKNAGVRESFVRGLKQCLDDYCLHFYCVASPSNRMFTEECKRVLGKSRYEEIVQEEWIDFKLLIAEKDELIRKYTQKYSFEFSKKEKEILKSGNDEEKAIYIGDFIAQMEVLRDRALELRK